MDSRTYFEIILYLRSGVYPRNCHWVEKNSIRRRSRKFYTKNGHLYLVGSDIQALHRSNARTKISQMHSSNGHLPRYKLMPLVSQKFNVMHLKVWCETVIRDCSTCNDNAIYRHTRGQMNFISQEVLDRVCREMGLEKKRRYCYELFKR